APARGSVAVCKVDVPALLRDRDSMSASTKCAGTLSSGGAFGRAGCGERPCDTMVLLLPAAVACCGSTGLRLKKPDSKRISVAAAIVACSVCDRQSGQGYGRPGDTGSDGDRWTGTVLLPDRGRRRYIRQIGRSEEVRMPQANTRG
ncbi:hypothetical protein PFISCL1PPCAC_3836, partial [Pristionchus fissidentatus]